MPVVNTKGAASSQGFGEFAKSGAATYIEDVFSTYLYTGTGAAQTITNNIDLSTKGGLVWTACRSDAYGQIRQTAPGTYLTQGPAGNVADSSGNFITAFNSTGFTIGDGTAINNSGSTFASWTFRKQAKFFDIVTYTGTGSAQTIAHNLGSVPGCIIVKANDYRNWGVYHQSLGADYVMYLDATNAKIAGDYWSSTNPTSANFTVGTGFTNLSGITYIAYIFASNAGGFGAAGTDNVITCGSFTTDGSGNATVNLGYEPQWVLVKRTDSSSGGNWFLLDTMRGLALSNNSDAILYANTAAAEIKRNVISPTATGFVADSASELYYNATYIYIAIRRGPMKTPTDATKVFNTVTVTGNDTDNRQVSSGFVTDFVIGNRRTGAVGANGAFVDRLRGPTPILYSYATDAEATGNVGVRSFAVQDGMTVGGNTAYSFNYSGQTYVNWMFQRAPGFFDEVCYTGTGTSGQTYNHNLGVAPELIIFKERSAVSSLGWPTVFGFSSTTVTFQGLLNDTGATYQSSNVTYTSSSFIKAQPTSTLITVGDYSDINDSGQTYVAYLFATCPGVSKVGTYTGTGATQTISCGFTGGARFVLVKRTDSTGNWYVWDTARGMVSGTDPSLLLNSSAAEVNANSIYTATGGFQIVSTAAGINASGGTYIFLAIA